MAEEKKIKDPKIKEFIVAIEISSSKITGIAGRKNADGSITVLAYAREESNSFVRRGKVFNIDKTAQCLINIKSKLEKTRHAAIGKAYIGIGGQSLHSIRNSVKMPLAHGTIISKETREELMPIEIALIQTKNYCKSSLKNTKSAMSTNLSQ